MMHPLVKLLYDILGFYSLLIVVYIVIRVLIHFRVINSYNAFIEKLLNILAALVEPLFKFIRKFVPLINGVDLSPVILLVALSSIQYSLVFYSIDHCG